MKTTPEETRATLVRIGVLTEDGRLTKKYRPAKKASAKKPGKTPSEEAPAR